MQKLLLILFFLPTLIYAQISHGGLPLGYNELKKMIVNFIDMPFIDNGKMLLRDENQKIKKNEPYRFGKKTSVNLGLENSGTWKTLKNGDRVWSLGIRSKGAKSINLIFSEYNLPIGGEVFIYNKDKTDFIGSFNYTNNKTHGKLGTTLIQGDAIIIEYYEPKAVKGKGKLTVGSITHAYKEILKSSHRAYGDADSCTININCSQGDDWQEESKSVVMLLIDGWGFCSGTLINNTSNDGKPYVLTAEHCVGNSDGSTWVYLFNWESPTCLNANPGMNNTISGSSIKSKWKWSWNDINATDFALLEISTPPPISYNPIYSGWSRLPVEPTRYISISHPSADIKKWEEESPQGREPGYWWTAPMLNLGQTESGSSGCGVWNEHGRLVGQLYGGSGWCNDINLINYWGRFDKSWDGAGTTISRLKDWLDPLATDSMFIDHFSPNLSTLNESITHSKTLIKVIDVLGRKVPVETKNQIKFYIYHDGTVEKKFNFR